MLETEVIVTEAIVRRMADGRLYVMVLRGADTGKILMLVPTTFPDGRAPIGETVNVRYTPGSTHAEVL